MMFYAKTVTPPRQEATARTSPTFAILHGGTRALSSPDAWRQGRRAGFFPVLISVVLAGGSALLAGCAAPGTTAYTPPALPQEDLALDAVLPAPEGWRLFRLGALRHATLPSAPVRRADGTPVPPADAAWRALTPPSGPFRPVQVVAAQRDHFYLVDAAGGRLCLYDGAAALLSTFPVPREFARASFTPAGRVAVFRGADDAFTFVDYGAGEAHQYAARHTTGTGAAEWVARGRVKLPGGLRDCMQPPGSEELFCRLGDGTPARFDGALNRAVLRDTERTSGGDAVWDTTAGQWTYAPRAAGSAAFRFAPALRSWRPAPRDGMTGDPVAP